MKCELRRETVLMLVGTLGFAACASEGPPTDRNLTDGVEAISLLGDTLRTPALDSAARVRLEEDLKRTRAAYDAAPLDADSIIWLGRRLAYLGRYREAIAIFTDGVRTHPAEARLLRHRGHRYITIRRFDLAIGDLQQAVRLVDGRPDEIEPDGMPNERGIPTSTLQFNIWYHLGLAHYLRKDFEQALVAYRACLAVSVNPDMQVATRHWLYMTLRRLGREAEASQVLEPVGPAMDVIENGAYHRLLLMYRGALSDDSLVGEMTDSDAVQNATVAYGIGNWYFYNGRADRANQIFTRILSGPQWAAFGYIAAESELALSSLDR